MFPRASRLKQRRFIRALFDRNRKDVHSVAAGSVRLVIRSVPRKDCAAGAPVQVGFAPGRGVRKAVARNRIKRVLREVYRVHQHLLVDLFRDSDRTLTVMVLFRGTPETLGRAREDLPRALQQVASRFRTAPGRSAQAGEEPSGGSV